MLEERCKIVSGRFIAKSWILYTPVKYLNSAHIWWRNEQE